MSIFIVVVMLIIIYFVAQNNKIQILFDQLHRIDSEIEQKLRRYIKADGQIDVFTIQDIRTMIRKDYIHQKRLDDFRVYKASMYKIKLILKSGLAVQALEMVTNDKFLKLKEMPIEYSDVEIFKK